jgi:hypothetical protein
MLRDYLVKPEGGSFELPPAGDAIEAVCISVIDCATSVRRSYDAPHFYGVF